jgi:photosystem II stability/assembly factor-like uncharacterized protein
MGLRLICKTGVVLVGLGALAVQGRASVPWFPLGPYGGDARSFAADPHDSRHLFLGTANGWLYESHDGGLLWVRLSQIDKRNDLVLDHILVDPTDARRLVVGAWTIDRPDGGVFLSQDGGKSWYDQAQMRGESIRSMARGIADSREIVAGTLKGIFRSNDSGTHWTQISPVGSAEIHEVESIAIDPADGNAIYAGTWHLPWKTKDGGAHWDNIKEGIIDDSDVFSIIIDPAQPNIVYASACSGIYKSVTGGEPNPRDQDKRFDKVQGIPSSARRTRKLAQDPSNDHIVYAGTTEGLYRTVDSGAQWERLTGSNVIVNDLYIDPRNQNHVLMATDRGGVLRSEDGGATFEPSNTGFSARQVVSYAADPHNAGLVYVGVVNDKTTGGVFESQDGGLRWQQQSEGLGGRDVFSLLALNDGTMLAGTQHGIFRLTAGNWSDSSQLAAAKPPAPKPLPARPVVKPTGRTTAANRRAAAAAAAKKKTAAAPAPVIPLAPTRVDGVVYTLAPQGGHIFAGTSAGLLTSSDRGATWAPVTAEMIPDARFLGVHGKMVLVGTLKRLAFSLDEGVTWDNVALPPDLTQIGAVAVDELGNLWVGGREGVYYSTDYGATWKTLRNLFITQVDSLYFDPLSHRVLVTSTSSTFAFAVSLPKYDVSYWDTGWNLRFARPVGDHLIGATLYDGMVVQPRMVVSKFATQKSGQ